jgi:hypothetical protein
MIFGKSYKEKKRAEQEDIKAKINGVEEFAWLPVRLANGKWIWLQKYYAYYHGGVYENGQYFIWSGSPEEYSPMFSAYLDKSDNHKRKLL